ncbi:MAG: hypothetical protein F4X64_10055, partial [Chloroflexi bacterium]|nr:hypothetical protein [Chloroflexota bacterium]
MDANRRHNEPLWRDAFRKILALEAHKGYADNAVSGGIRRFIERWEPDLREYLADDARSRQLIEQPYRDLDPDQRRAWVAVWQAALEETSTQPEIPPTTVIPATPVIPAQAGIQSLPAHTDPASPARPEPDSSARPEPVEGRPLAPTLL